MKRSTSRVPLTLLSLLALAGICTSASADPCKAIPDRGPMPNYLPRGKQFSGPVVYVGDGDSLCVDVGPRFPASNTAAGTSWVEVRLADFYAPELHEPGGTEAKAALERIAKGRAVTCIADHRSYDRVVAACRLNGRDLGDLLRASGAREGGRGYRGPGH